jgi:hypothetical protein
VGSVPSSVARYPAWHRLHIREGDLAEFNDPAHELTASVGYDLVAAEREVPVLRTGILDHAPDVEGEVAPMLGVTRVHSVEDRADERPKPHVWAVHTADGR